MNRTTRTRTIAIASAASLALLGAACADSGDDVTDPGLEDTTTTGGDVGTTTGAESPSESESSTTTG